MPASAMRHKKTVSVTLEPVLLRQAREAGINLSATLATTLRHEIRKSESERWKRTNRKAIFASSAFSRFLKFSGSWTQSDRTNAAS